MSSIQITSWEHTCERCSEKWKSFKENPSVCAWCRSPYWNKPRKGYKYDGVRNLSPGAEILVPWPGAPYQGHTVDKLVDRLNSQGGHFTIKWSKAGATVKNES